MYEFFIEKKINTFLPKYMAKKVQYICTAVCQIGGIKAQTCESLNALTACNYYSEFFWRWKMSAFHAEMAPRYKMLNYIRSYKNRIDFYISLPFLCFLRLSLEDWFVYEDNSLKSAA